MEITAKNAENKPNHSRKTPYGTPHNPPERDRYYLFTRQTDLQIASLSRQSKRKIRHPSIRKQSGSICEEKGERVVAVGIATPDNSSLSIHRHQAMQQANPSTSPPYLSGLHIGREKRSGIDLLTAERMAGLDLAALTNNGLHDPMHILARAWTGNENLSPFEVRQLVQELFGTEEPDLDEVIGFVIGITAD